MTMFHSKNQFLFPERSANRFTCALFAFTVALLALTAVPVRAGGYELIKGKGVEVCEAYGKNLNSFRPSVLMLCERLISPDFAQFAKPAWEELTLDQIATLNVETGDQFLSEASPRSKPLNESKSERIRKAKAILSASFDNSWPLSAWRAQFDLDNDGKLDSFKKEVQGKCAVSRFPTVLLQPIGGYVAHTHFSKIFNAVQNQPEKQMSFELAPGNVAPVTTRKQRGAYMFPDVFRYKDEWYLDMLATGPSGSQLEKLYVFKHRAGTTSEICEFRVNFVTP